MDLRAYDLVLLNTSGGKDSQAMLDHVVRLAREQGATDRLVAVHADLGRVEWKGTRELAEQQARAYGLRFVAVTRPQGDLLTHVEQRRMWPSSSARYCTSDHKRGQVARVLTGLVRALRLDRPARVLNCLGFRAEESPARAKRPALSRDTRQSNGRREVTTWLPTHTWTVAQVWATIRASGVPHHPAYDLGMPRLSCVFCIFAPRPALTLAGKHNPELLAEYAAVEARIGHQFRQDVTMAQVKADVDAGVDGGPIRTWGCQ